jgi:hypothetical protein
MWYTGRPAAEQCGVAPCIRRRSASCPSCIPLTSPTPRSAKARTKRASAASSGGSVKDVGVREKGHQFDALKLLIILVARDGIEPPTHGFSAGMFPNRALTKCYTSLMSDQSIKDNPGQAIFILTATTSEYTAARQQLKLRPQQAQWLTGASRLNGLSTPKVYRFGSWQTLPRLKAIEAALAEVQAEIIDLQEEK